MIHCFENNGLRIALDVHSGAVHVLDELAFELLLSFPDDLPETCPPALLEHFSRRYGQDEVRDTYAELLELRKGGLLYSEDDYQPYADALTASPLKAMCLHVSHDCNLRCRYCFAGQGIYGGKPQTMPFEVAKAAIDFLVAQSGPRRHLELDFFGGSLFSTWASSNRR